MSRTAIINGFIMMGKFFGYPDCCIVAFIKRALDLKAGTIRDITEDQRKVIDNNGFVPCDKCAKKLIKEERTLDTLIRNRKCSKPYPEEGEEEEFDNYVEQLKLE